MSCVEAVYLIWISEKAASLGIEAVEKLDIFFFFFQNRFNLQLLKAVEKLRISEISNQTIKKH